MFELKMSEPMNSAEEAPFDVTLDKEYTVKEFIDAVMTKTDEWGCITVTTDPLPSMSWLLKCPRCEYKYGKTVTAKKNDLFTTAPELLSKTVVSVSAKGGWTRMDYVLYVK